MKRLYPLLFMALFFGCGNDTLNQKQTSFTPTLNTPQVYVAGSTVASGVPINSAIQLEFYISPLNTLENLARITLSHVQTSSLVPLEYQAGAFSNVVIIKPAMHTLSANSYYTLTVQSGFTFEDLTTTTMPFSYDFYTSSSSDAIPPTFTVENNLSVPFELQGSLKFRSNEPLNIHHASTQSYYFVKETNTSVQVPALPIAGPTMSMFTPQWPLEHNTSYTFTLPVLYDLANNAATGTLSVSITTASKFGVTQTFNDGTIAPTAVQNYISTEHYFYFFDSNRTLISYYRESNATSSEINASVAKTTFFADNNLTPLHLTMGVSTNGYVLATDANDTNRTLWYTDPPMSFLTETNTSDGFEKNATNFSIEGAYSCFVDTNTDQNSVRVYDDTFFVQHAILNIVQPKTCHFSYIEADFSTSLFVTTVNSIEKRNELDFNITTSISSLSYTPSEFTIGTKHLFWRSNDTLFVADFNLTILGTYTHPTSNLGTVAIYGDIVFIAQQNSSDVLVLSITDPANPILFSTIKTAAEVTSLSVIIRNDFVVAHRNLLVGHANSIEQISLNGFGEAEPKITVPLSYKPAGLTQDTGGWPFIWHENLIEEYDPSGLWLNTNVFSRTIHELIALDVYPNFIITDELGLNIVQLDSNSSSITVITQRNISNISAVARNTLGMIYVGTSDGSLRTFSENNLFLTEGNFTNIGKPITSIFPFETSLLVGTLDNNITIFNTDSNGSLTSINQTIATKDVPLDIKVFGNATVGYMIAVAEGFSGVEIFHSDSNWTAIDYNHTLSTPGFVNDIYRIFSSNPHDAYKILVTDTTGVVWAQRVLSYGFEEIIQRHADGTKWRKILFDPVSAELKYGLSSEGLIIFGVTP